MYKNLVEWGKNGVTCSQHPLKKTKFKEKNDSYEKFIPISFDSFPLKVSSILFSSFTKNDNLCKIWVKYHYFWKLCFTKLKWLNNFHEFQSTKINTDQKRRKKRMPTDSNQLSCLFVCVTLYRLSFSF